ncbi:unnamed protein product [Didymodactylos carnosus]|uniref:G-protein coupled receptors family 1 profile domain-containing protein n=3 Tax=Didymodactylos carnosus TaxID=1234261 RepID=A0A813P979_9BILA|nr:unnamed protein product [Didymodactylos carnosus]CAF3525892.1 unnamed protein product [Didymodactylos carnosus]
MRTIAPLIIIISTILNSLIAVVLLQRQLRSPTNILLLAIALYDTLTGLFPFPVLLYVYTFRHCDDYPPFNYCWFHRINHDILPFIFHTCSIWITVALAIQRYIYVCHSEKAKQYCTLTMALKAIACINLFALILTIPMFLEGTFTSKEVKSKKFDKIFQACIVFDRSQDPKYKIFFSFYSLFRALIVNVGPCTVLVIFNAILIVRMKKAKQHREKLIRRRSYETRTQEQTSVTLMLIIVVTLFLLVEIPNAIQIILTAILDFVPIQGHDRLSLAAQILNFCVLLSYPINFFIYCRMSRAFRDAFKKLLYPSWSDSDNTQLVPLGHNGGGPGGSIAPPSPNINSYKNVKYGTNDNANHEQHTSVRHAHFLSDENDIDTNNSIHPKSSTVIYYDQNKKSSTPKHRVLFSDEVNDEKPILVTNYKKGIEFTDL